MTLVVSCQYWRTREKEFRTLLELFKSNHLHLATVQYHKDYKTLG